MLSSYQNSLFDWKTVQKLFCLFVVVAVCLRVCFVMVCLLVFLYFFIY